MRRSTTLAAAGLVLLAAMSAAQAGGDPGVLALQRALAWAGFDPGPPDGLDGPRTRQAVRAWQRDQGLAPTGRLSGRETAELTGRPFIRVELRRLFPSEIQLATAGRLEGTVRDIQSRLAALGYYAGPRDGRITPAIRHAARHWRRDHGLAVHGALDQPLLRRLPPAPAELARGE
ncbi:MAG: peptidoglycan-binding protein [Alphaproteobacteria bacterium]|nr:peptidoglycan-binding protein [Alphaproteobacteria bacterium]